MAKVIRRESRQRGAAGKLVKFVFIVFNVAMLALMLLNCSSVGHVAGAASNLDSSGQAAVTAGAGIAGTMIGGAILFFWALGTVVLGALTYFTRGPSVVTEETIES